MTEYQHVHSEFSKCRDIEIADGRKVPVCVVRTTPELFQLLVDRIINENQDILDRLAKDD